MASTLHFEAWLKTKTEAFQLEKPGRGRWELWHRGKISFLDLIDQRGNPLSVAELEALVARL